MEIVHVGAELAPVAKVGGLGDVVQGLSHALMAKGHDVEVFLPKYDVLDVSGLERVAPGVWRGKIEGIRVCLIESKEFFERGTIYGCEDDADRFAHFCLRTLEYLRDAGRSPDVIHVHDWHAALAAPLLKQRFAELKSWCLFTIHNLSYQGECDREVLERVGLTCPEIVEGAHYNLMKGGLLFADHITTVSPTYAKEILTPEMGGKLQPTLKKCEKKLSGVLNGIDYAYWDPKNDPFLPVPLVNRGAKREIKRVLQDTFALAQEERPLVAAITRLVPQKGPELIKAALLKTLELGGQFVLLGSASDAATSEEFENLKRELKGCPHAHLELTYNEELSHLVFGASDLFIVPSRFEPCGLTQMIAMRYGSVPLVRATGGLVDTVFDGENGFTFAPYTAEAIEETLERALPLWHTKSWKKLVEKGMSTNFSWEKPADAYIKLYNSCLSLQ